MANIDNVQLPDGSSYNIVDNTSGFATQNYVDSAVDSITKTTIGLGNVDNTSDLNKPVSTAQQTAIDNAVVPKADKTDIAPVESSSTATRNYAIGDQFYYNGLLYKATAVINRGGTINVGGNCALADTVVKQLKDINNKTIKTAQSITTGFLKNIAESYVENNTFHLKCTISFNVGPASQVDYNLIAYNLPTPKSTESIMGSAIAYIGETAFPTISMVDSDGNLKILITTAMKNGAGSGATSQCVINTDYEIA